jgi:hypothetical protein
MLEWFLWVSQTFKDQISLDDIICVIPLCFGNHLLSSLWAGLNFTLESGFKNEVFLFESAT